jgi:hypothetical protein
MVERPAYWCRSPGSNCNPHFYDDGDLLLHLDQQPDLNSQPNANRHSYRQHHTYDHPNSDANFDAHPDTDHDPNSATHPQYRHTRASARTGW